MRRRIALITLAAIVLGRGGAVAAGDFAPVPELGTSILDFDAGDGHFSEWGFDSGSLNGLRARAQVLRLGHDPHYTPAFTILLAKGKRSVAFQIRAEDRSAPLSVGMTLRDNGKVLEQANFVRTVKLGETLDIAVDWTKAGKVDASIGGETKSLSLGSPVTRVTVSAFSSEVKLDPLRIGRTK